MIWKTSKILPAWINSLVVSYDEFCKESKKYRCKIVDVNTDEKSNETSFLVMICGIKPQFVPYLSKDLVVNDSMLKEFSSFDVRAITFYALLGEKNFQKLYQSRSIAGQEFSEEGTIFIIRKLTENTADKYSAHELYCDPNLFSDFSSDDIKNIISTAIQEQTIKDFKMVYER
jgi:hypothetical protein